MTPLSLCRGSCENVIGVTFEEKSPLMHLVDRRNLARVCFPLTAPFSSFYALHRSCVSSFERMFISAISSSALFMSIAKSSRDMFNHQCVENRWSWAKTIFSILRAPTKGFEDTLILEHDGITLSPSRKLTGLRSTKYFHHRFPFDFRLFTIATLRCIIQLFASQLNKTDYVPFIEEEYAIDRIRFNTFVLSKCGIFIGYLYGPERESAYFRARQQVFSSRDIALDVIKKDSQHRFVVFLRAKFGELSKVMHISGSSFLICPAIDINKIVYDQEICDGPHSLWILSPTAVIDSPSDYSKGLHEALIHKSDHYRQ